MKVSGFSFIRNAIEYDFPVVESILSVLPLCDEFIVAVGNSDDDTRALIESIQSDKIRIIDTVWDDSLREGGKVLAVETDKALAEIASDSDWAIYIQGDEVIHEKYHSEILCKMNLYAKNDKVDGLLFKYLHFYGSYDYVGTSSNWYPHEIRLIKNNKGIYSYRDAQGFRKGENEKLDVVPIDAYIYHYGWVREPAAMQKKQLNFHSLYHNDEWMQENKQQINSFEYEQHVKSIRRFKGTHPNVMQKRIDSINWQFDYDISFSELTAKDKLKNALSLFGIKLGYRNYQIIKG